MEALAEETQMDLGFGAEPDLGRLPQLAVGPVMSFARPTGVEHAKPVDFENQRLQLTESKTGPRFVYLSPPALEVLNGLERKEGNPFVITGAKRGAHLINLRKPWGRMRKKAGLENVRLHDLRHSFASVAAAGGLSLPLIGALLGHSQPQTTARYAHLADDPLKQAANLIGSRIAAAMARSTPRDTESSN